MKTSCISLILVMLSVLRVSCVKVMVIRDDSSQQSEEESNEGLSAEESEEIDLLMDLIEREALDRKPPPVTTVRVVKRKPSTELATQNSFRKERLHSKPADYKEYHVHYHNHQHKPITKTMVGFGEDIASPTPWDSQASLLSEIRDFEKYRQYRKPQSFTQKSPVKTFKDLERFLESQLRAFPSYSSNSEAPKDMYKTFESILQHSKSEDKSFKRLKYLQDVLNEEDEKDDEEEERGKFLNKDRFAAFKDFSDIESPTTNPPPSPKEKIRDTEGDVNIDEFAIVIKSKPRIPLVQKENLGNQKKKENPRVNKHRPPPNRPFNLPRVLEVAGGTPKYIEKLNRLQYEQQRLRAMAMRNSVESRPQKFVHLGTVPKYPPHPQFHHQPIPNFQHRLVNGWVLKRVL